MSYPEWKASPEYKEWVESGERDEDFDYYYSKWERKYRNS